MLQYHNQRVTESIASEPSIRNKEAICLNAKVSQGWSAVAAGCQQTSRSYARSTYSRRPAAHMLAFFVHHSHSIIQNRIRQLRITPHRPNWSIPTTRWPLHALAPLRHPSSHRLPVFGDGWAAGCTASDARSRLKAEPEDNATYRFLYTQVRGGHRRASLTPYNGSTASAASRRMQTRLTHSL